MQKYCKEDVTATAIPFHALIMGIFEMDKKSPSSFMHWSRAFIAGDVSEGCVLD
jgi:hypothetical protein